MKDLPPPAAAASATAAATAAATAMSGENQVLMNHLRLAEDRIAAVAKDYDNSSVRLRLANDKIAAMTQEYNTRFMHASAQHETGMQEAQAVFRQRAFEAQAKADALAQNHAAKLDEM